MAEYSPIIQQFITDFQVRKWDAKPFESALEIVKIYPEKLVALINAIVDEMPKGGTFHDVLFSFLPLEDFPQVVRHALAAFTENRKNEAAEAVFSYTSRQCLAALHPYLPEIFTLGINERSYDAEWPWREAGDKPLDFLRPIIEDTELPDTVRIRAWEAVLQTRHPALLKYALDVSNTLPLVHNPSVYFREIGYDLASGQPSPLYAEAVYHLQFPADYFNNAARPLWLQTTFHPTWNLDAPLSGPFTFGGTLLESGSGNGTCPSCGKRLDHLVTLDPIPQGLGVTGISMLTLAVCLSCLGWEKEVLFYRHDSAGQPEGINVSGEKTLPKFPAVPLQPTLVHLAETPSRWRWQNWSSENLHRVGGFPCWIQSAEHPSCPECGAVMHFLMQLDSNLPTTDGQEWLWGSGGIGYIFWCDGCKISSTLWQCT